MDLAQSTAEAESLLSKTNYRLVLSDMGRTENGVYRETAGIDLLIAVRGDKSNVPYVIYCSPSGAKKFGRRAEGEGGRITSSPTILRGVLDELAPDTSKQEI